MTIGSIIAWGSDTIPDNWLLCDGSAVSRTTYADLFNIIGTNFGVGDGSTTFNLPDLRGRVGIGKSSDTEFDTLGETGGEKTHTLTINEMPSHYHTNSHYAVGSNAPGYTGWEENVGSGSSGTYRATANSESAGGGQAHNNLQPYIVTNYIIKALSEGTVKISELESASSIDGTEVMPIVQNGSTKKVSANTLLGNIETDITNIQEDIQDIIDGEVYSTSEVLTNKKWIDNKPIYRKVITGTITNDDVVSTNVDSLISVCGSATLSGILRVVPFYQFYANQEYIFTFNNSVNEPNNIKAFILSQGAASSAYGSNIILEYTKTTD